MAPKSKSPLVDQPPSASSSEEQEQEEQSAEEEGGGEEEEEEESEEESEEEEPKTAPPVEKKSATQKPLQIPQQSPQSSSSSESKSNDGSDSDAESGQSQQPSPSASDFHVKPSVPAATSRTPTKRPQETQQQAEKERDSRNRKKAKIAVQEEEKKSSVVTTPIRLWNDEDQIALLKGMSEFKEQKGAEPSSDMAAFHDFIKGKLQVEVSKSQLSDKLRRLKKKFLTSVKNGPEPVFSRPHDYLVFEHSRKIWGGANAGAGSSNNGVTEAVNNNNTNGKATKKSAVEAKKSPEPKKSAKVSTFTKPKDDEKPKEHQEQVAVKEVVKEDTVKGGDQQQDFKSKYPRLAASFSMAELSKDFPNAVDMLKENMDLIDGDKAKVLEEKWKKLHDEEADLMLKRLDLIREHYKLVVDAMRGN